MKSTSEVDPQEEQSSSVFKFPSPQTSLPKLVLPSVFQRTAKTPRSPPAAPASVSPSIVAEDTTQPTTPLERYDLRTPVQPPPLSLGVTPIIEEIRSLPAYPESASSTDFSIAEDQPYVVHQSPELTSQSAEESSRTSTRATMAMVPFAEIYKDIPKCQDEGKTTVLQTGAANAASMQTMKNGSDNDYSQKDVYFIIGITVAATLLLQMLWRQICKRLDNRKQPHPVTI
ncbi:uncharacterized protein LOC129808889 [Phlebotomus papatasi]|uniref:uncharacterized protein LOC129808889 n=1 Tax=Phlebotomus papatasi TaxID=29031 RepID=UPI002484399C|nr:uncharacterized protein LOC129808889 [Phlebotomus papatasi]